MEYLSSLGTGGVVIIAVILLLRELKPFISRNGVDAKKPCKDEIVAGMKEIERRQEERDRVSFDKMDQQTTILQSVDKNLALMHLEIKKSNGD